MHREHPTDPFATPFHTCPQERGYYIALIVMGLTLAAVAMVLEFTAVPNPDEHGLWTTIALLGLGIATVFWQIISMKPAHQ